MANNRTFSPSLQAKIDTLMSRRPKVKLGDISFDSPLLLAPMSSICTAPYRLLMEELGAGGTVSELVSCHGINYKNEKTVKMLEIHPREKNIGLQLFGEDGTAMAEAAKVAQEREPKFIDINMGCPVRKVVSKGGGSALMKDTSKLGKYFNQMKSAIEVPLTIKIRTGWDDDSINAQEVIHIAKEEGVEFVAIHGRTRTQAYKGLANWDLLESIAQTSPLPIIGNGDLHSWQMTQKRLMATRCQALMLGRGPLRNPFIFLESFLKEDDDIQFTPSDYLEVIERFRDYLEEYTDRERTVLITLRKNIVWMAAGFPNVTHFRNAMFQTPDIEETMNVTREYFDAIKDGHKKIDHNQVFMAGGHG
ncbi:MULTISPECIES: tRNA dihydrouridine synthase [unclassified Halobacteriovorax]|uniref:tRNA dihydrouridine synthase n=1 Tax=unclassified Halobacteriovorax TaxID=2639665 RepID=UPI000EA25FD5|nr:tRNA-dihydrouridine synthase [Halobacteriovorax sp. BALOs_7]